MGLVLVLECLLRPGRSVEFCWVSLLVREVEVRVLGTVYLRLGGSSR